MRSRRPFWRAACVLALAVQLFVLYTPQAVGPQGPRYSDKVVHAAIFGAVAFTAVRGGLPVRPVVALLLVHAVVSELIQHFLLPDRSGDPFDAVADATGVLAATFVVLRTRVGRRARMMVR